MSFLMPAAALAMARVNFARVTPAVDIAPAMHFQARSSVSWWKQSLTVRGNQTSYVCGDIEQMPLKDSSAGLVWSSLTLQWCNDINCTLAEMHRVLQAGGLFMFSTFDPDTLKELCQAFRSADNWSCMTADLL